MSADPLQDVFQEDTTAVTAGVPVEEPAATGRPWLVGAALILLGGMALQLGLLVFAMYVLLGVLLVSRHFARVWTESISADREVNRYEAEIGDRLAVIVNIKNEGRWPVAWLLIEDSLPRSALRQKPPRIKVEKRRLKIMRLAAGEVFSLRYQIQVLMRGYYQIGPLLTESGDLFGLHRRYRVLTEPNYVLVYPRIVPLLGYDVASRRLLGEIRFTHRLFEDPSRIAGVREYAAGDPINRIHWKATARTGALHCKTFEPTSIAGATLVLDFHQDSYDARGEPHRSELAVTTVASIANALVQVDQQVGLISNGHDAADRIRLTGWKHEFQSRQDAQQEVAELPESDRLAPLVVPTRRGSDQLPQILRTLARIELSNGLSFPQLVLETASRMPRDATVIAVLPAVPESTAAALGSLRRRGIAVTVILTMFSTEDDFSDAVGRLMAEQISVRQVESDEGVAQVCSAQTLGRRF